MTKPDVKQRVAVLPVSELAEKRGVRGWRGKKMTEGRDKANIGIVNLFAIKYHTFKRNASVKKDRFAVARKIVVIKYTFKHLYLYYAL